MTVSTENATLRKSTKSRNSDSSVFRGTNSNWDVGTRVGVRGHTDCVSQKPHCTSFSEGQVQTSDLKWDVSTRWPISNLTFTHSDVSCRRCRACRTLMSHATDFTRVWESVFVCAAVCRSVLQCVAVFNVRFQNEETWCPISKRRDVRFQKRRGK